MRHSALSLRVRRQIWESCRRLLAHARSHQFYTVYLSESMAVPAGALAIAGSPVGIGNAEPGHLVGGNILLRVRAANGRDDVFLQRRVDSFRGLIDNFCWLWGGVVGLVRFSFKGEPLDADNDTPEKLEMREHDVICKSSLLQAERCDLGISFIVLTRLGM